MFDRKLKQKREYQKQEMRIKQFELYREDVRDLVDLTVSKMDNYLLINTLLMGFSIRLFCEGRPEPGKSPSWLHWLYVVSNSGALLYFVLSVWLAMHASISAHSFGVRLLTQFVRLPVPTKEQIDAFRFRAEAFEGGSLRDMLRLPALRQQLRRLIAAMDNFTAPQEPTRDVAAPTEADTAAGGDNVRVPGEAQGFIAHPGDAALQDHVQLFRRVQVNWQAYDAYARVSMAMGTNQLLYAMSYYCVIMFVAENHASWPALCCTVVFAALGWLITRLDLYLSNRWLKQAGVLLTTSPVLVMVITTVYKSQAHKTVKRVFEVVVPLLFLLHITWIIFFIRIAAPDHHGDVALPTKFRAVLYLDVYGWLNKRNPEQQLPAGEAAPQEPAGARDGPQTEAPLPEGVRDALVRLCQRLQAEISQDLRLWEHPQVEEELDSQDPMLEDIANLRRDFDVAARNLGRLAGEAEPADADLRGPVWLKLRLTWRQEASRSGDFFLNLDSGEVRFVEPQDFAYQENRTLAGEDLHVERMTPAAAKDRCRALPGCQGFTFQTVGSGGRVMVCFKSTRELREATGWTSYLYKGRTSDLGSLRRALEAFRDRVQQLAELPEPHGATAPAAPSAEQGPAASSEPMATPPRLTDAGSDGSTWSPLLLPSVADDLHGADPDANAVQMHTRVGESSEGEAAPAPVRQAAVVERPPGQLPWRTFFLGSMALLLAWIIGFVWSCFMLAEIDIPLTPIVAGKYGWTREPEMVFAGISPHPFFNPTGVACHPSWGPMLLIHEKYAVHTLQLGIDNTLLGTFNSAPHGALSPALTECLSEALDFQANGILSVGLECDGAGNKDSACNAVLLGAAGQRALRCRLGTDAASSAVLPGRQIQLHGGPWRALAVGNQGIWALRGMALIQLQPRLGAPDDLLPQMHITHEATENVSQLHSFSNSTVLGLEPGGRLHAWFLDAAPHISWQLPTNRRWAGVCAGAGALYFVSTAHGGTDFHIWRAALPPELAARV